MNRSFPGSKICRYLLIGIVFPFLIQYVFYFRFTPNYNVQVFSPQSFTKEYNVGVYRYRLLGKHLQLWLYEKLASVPQIRNMKEGSSYTHRLDYLDAHFDQTFYFTYFVIAVVFCILTSLLILLIFDMQDLFRMTGSAKILATASLILFIGFTHFVITPYDTLSYFLLTLAIFLFLKLLQTQKNIYLLILCGVILVATLNRESSLLILSFMAGIYTVYYKLFDFRWIRKMILPVACFAIPYIVLRFLLHGDNQFHDGNRIMDNLNPFHLFSLTGILFAVIVFYVIFNLTDKSANKKLIAQFLLMALPYILIIPVVGIMIEYRLWVPVFLPAFLLSKMDATLLEAWFQKIKAGNLKIVR